MYSFAAVSAAYQYEVGRDADTVFTLCSRLYNRVNGDGPKTAKIIKKMILLSITLTFRRCDGGW